MDLGLRGIVTRREHRAAGIEGLDPRSELLLHHGEMGLFLPHGLDVRVERPELALGRVGALERQVRQLRSVGEDRPPRLLLHGTAPVPELGTPGFEVAPSALGRGERSSDPRHQRLEPFERLGGSPTRILGRGKEGPETRAEQRAEPSDRRNRDAS